MADLLIKHLKSKTEEHSALGLLYSQWDFDEKLIPKALQTIGTLFPHYSRHDESHSKQILVNIERLLGENIKLLTATDTWMLLESAYWHDIGMVVPHADLQASIDDPEFQAYVDSIAAQPHHDLNSFASAFKVKSDTSLIFHHNTPLEMLSKFREFMAEWFRRKHPARAEQIIRSPLSAAGITSPRTELIPARLFKLLGRICQMHGAPFSEMLATTGLPFREAGLAQDDCHPRFIASLLRMGDLLDLDDNRFCPVMQRIAGEDRPKLSKAHEDKHAGMRHLRIDQERIEVIAECETVDGYLEAFRWFDWLKQEVQNQMTHWRDIVPNRELGLLPMLGPLTVRLRGDLQILKEGERPAYSIDAKKAAELLQGHNLYSNRYACIREILQNSVDATLIQIWLTNRKADQKSKWSSPEDEDVQALFAQASISVTLEEKEPERAIDPDKSLWTLTISDSGTGISRNDLEYILKIGGSYGNTERQREISCMPEWMKPSGAFGIGMQSIFMLCDEVHVKTKSIFTNEIFDITLYSPTGPKEGLVVLRKLDNDISLPHGTILTVNFELDRTANYWLHNVSDNSIVHHLATTLDPILDDNHSYEAAQLADQVAKFGGRSLIPVRGCLATSHGNFEITPVKTPREDQGEGKPWRFVKTQDAEVRIRYEPGPPRKMVESFYRGQSFDSSNLYFPYVSIEIDLMSGAAGSWLNFSRDKISAHATRLFKKTILTALESAVEQDLKSANSCPLLQPENRPVYAFFLKGMAYLYQGKWTDYANTLGDAWLDHTLDGTTSPLREIFKRPNWTLGQIHPHRLLTPNCDILISERIATYLIFQLLTSEWTKTAGNTVQFCGRKEILADPTKAGSNPLKDCYDMIQGGTLMARNSLHLRRDHQPPYDECALATEIFRASITVESNRRYILNSPKFSQLSIKTEEEINAWPLFPGYPTPHPVMLPFLFQGIFKDTDRRVEVTPEQMDLICRWVQVRLVTPATLVEVRRWYEDLIQYIDDEIMKPTIFWDRWKIMRGMAIEGK